MKEIEFAAVVSPDSKRVHWARTHLTNWSWGGTKGTTLCMRTTQLGTITSAGDRKWCKRCERELTQELRGRGLV
jgi:hypothetical protein